MPGIKKYLAGAVLSAALFFTTAANAMPIPRFDKMAQSDKNDYRASLVEGAAKALNAHGDAQQAQKLFALFTDQGENGGARQLAKNMEIFRELNKENAANPNNKEPVYEVEHALALTLKDNGIVVPVDVLLTLGKDFKPKSPPSEKTKQTR